MDTKTKIRYGIIALGVIGAFVLLFRMVAVFKPKDNSGEMVKEIVKAYDRAFTAKQETIELMVKQNEKKDEEIIQLKKNDSLLASSRQVLKQNYEKVPGIIRSYNNPELRSAVLEFAETH